MPSMRRILTVVFGFTAFALLSHMGFAQEAADATEKTGSVSPLIDDIKKARDLILEGTGNSFGRGMMVAVFEPVFLASMFCLGLWAGQMSERVTAIWALPLLVFGTTLLGAFITAYHTDWKPDLGGEGVNTFLTQLGSTDAFAVVIGLLAGAAVGMRLIIPPFFAFLVAAAAGLGLGFSQIAEVGEHKNALIPFWAGFGLTGLLVNIFGIGFETFFQSIKLDMVTRWVGFATLALSFLFGTKVF